MRKEKCNPHISGVNGFWESLKWAMEWGNTDAKKIWKLFHSPDAPEQLYGCYEIDRGGRNDETDLKIRHYPYLNKEMTAFDWAHYDVLTTTDLIKFVSPKCSNNNRVRNLRSFLACASHPTFQLCEGYNNIMEVFSQLPYCLCTLCGQELFDPANIMVAEFLTKIAPSQLLVARDSNGTVHGWAILWHGIFEDKLWEFQKFDATALGCWCIDDSLHHEALREIVLKNAKKFEIDLVKDSSVRNRIIAANKDFPPLGVGRWDMGQAIFSTELYPDMSYRGGLPRADVMGDVIGYDDSISLTTSHFGHKYDWETSFRAGSLGGWSNVQVSLCPKCRERYTDNILCNKCIGDQECYDSVFGNLLATKLRKHPKYGYLPDFFWGKLNIGENTRYSDRDCFFPKMNSYSHTQKGVNNEY